MGQSKPREPLLWQIYHRYLGHRDVIAFVHAVSAAYSPGTLQRLSEHDDPRVRRAAVHALGFVGGYEANHSVGRAMQDEDLTVRLLAETACRRVWNRAGHPDHRRQLNDAIRLNAGERYRDAIEMASSLIDIAPSFAEAWYQRGAAWFRLEDFTQAIHDFNQALERNPYHFVAAAAIGDAHLQLGQPVAALASYRRALRLNPTQERVRDLVAKLAHQTDGS